MFWQHPCFLYSLEASSILNQHVSIKCLIVKCSPGRVGGGQIAPIGEPQGSTTLISSTSPAEILNLGCTEESIKNTNTFGPFQPGCIKSLWVGSGIHRSFIKAHPVVLRFSQDFISTAVTSLCLNFLTQETTAILSVPTTTRDIPKIE